MRKLTYKKHACLLILIFMILLAVQTDTYADIQVHFLNVGQGDAALVLCDGEAMLVDGGSPSQSQLIYTYIKNTLGLEEIDYIVASHPHEDHIGGLAAALNAVPVDLVISSTLSWDSRAFDSMVRYATAQGTPIVTAMDGDGWQVGGAEVTVVVCWPEAPITNDSSIVMRIDYGDVSFLFTGDAEMMAEYIAIDSATPIKADVLKVGHHGSRTSSTLEFLTAVDPDYAVISCGKNNPYGHPHQTTLDKLKLVGAEVFRTDIQGTVICTSDGKSITWETQFTTKENLYQAPATAVLEDKE